MLFNSFIFIFAFLPICLAGFYFLANKRLQLPFLFLSSLFFYAYWSSAYVFLLLFTVILDFYLAKAIFRTSDAKKKKSLLIVSICSNVGVLGFFKYTNFLIETFNATLAPLIGSEATPVLQIILPIGISFYTFQSMSYVIDVYRGTSSAHARLLEFSTYVTLFPHQISGPLVRHNVIVPQLEDRRTYLFNSTNFWQGCYFFVFGIAKKVLIADRIAAGIDPLVQNINVISHLEAWVAMLGYSMQLYFDFGGYSDMAVGLGLMMNIQFPQNFNSPYKSYSVTDFWKRWHMTLSSWLKDYLYISLGGNRGGSFKTYRNLFVTMFIGGLWHGAHWNFAIWGSLHGLALALERFFKAYQIPFIKNKKIAVLITFLFVCIAWIFFRSPDFQTACIWLKKIFFLSSDSSFQLNYMPTKYKDRCLTALIIALLGAFFVKNTWEMKFQPTLRNAIVLAFLFFLSLTYLGEESPFLYFQF